MKELKWKWAYFQWLDAPEKQHESAVNAGYAKVVLKSEADKVIAELKAENKKLKASSEQIMNEMIRKVLIYPHEMVSLEDAYKLAVSLKNTKRALLLARAERYKMREFIAREEGNLCNQMSWSRILRERTYGQWVDQLLRIANLAKKLQYKCRAKAEEYK